jgi:hypothetical protein
LKRHWQSISADQLISCQKSRFKKNSCHQKWFSGDQEWFSGDQKSISANQLISCQKSRFKQSSCHQKWFSGDQKWFSGDQKSISGSADQRWSLDPDWPAECRVEPHCYVVLEQFHKAFRWPVTDRAQAPSLVTRDGFLATRKPFLVTRKPFLVARKLFFCGPSHLEWPKPVFWLPEQVYHGTSNYSWSPEKDFYHSAWVAHGGWGVL